MSKAEKINMKLLNRTLLIFICWNIFLTFALAKDERGLNLINKEKIKINENNQSSEFRALLIGNNNYQYWPPLKTAVHDVDAFAVILNQNYGFKQNNIKVIRNGTRRQMLRAFNDLKKYSQSDDSVLIYYAGHGQYDDQNEGYWVPIDGKVEDTFDYIPNKVVLSQIRAIKAKHKFLISDSCFSGNLLTRGLKIPKESQLIRSRYFNEKSKLKSVQGLSSGGNEPVFDGGVKWEGHSIFAYHLLAQLRANQRPFMSATLLGVKLAINVANDTATDSGAGQTPIFRPISNQGDQGGEFFFRKSDFERKKILFVYKVGIDQHFEDLTEDARQTIKSGLAEQLKLFPQFELVDEVYELNTENWNKELNNLMQQTQSDYVFTFGISGSMEKQVTLMWNGLATLHVEIEAYRFEKNRVEHINKLSLPSQKIPIRTWQESNEFQRKQYLKVASKLVRKWSKGRIRKFIDSLED